MQFNAVKWKTLTLVLLLLTGCVALVESQSSKDVVEKRAAERWLALIEGRLETAYLFETPEYRELYSYEYFGKKIQGVGAWQKAEVENVDCKENKCVVTTRVYVTIMFGRGFGSTESSSPVKEHWIRSSSTGEWYHFSNQ